MMRVPADVTFYVDCVGWFDDGQPDPGCTPTTAYLCECAPVRNPEP